MKILLEELQMPCVRGWFLRFTESVCIIVMRFYLSRWYEWKIIFNFRKTKLPLLGDFDKSIQWKECFNTLVLWRIFPDDEILTTGKFVIRQGDFESLMMRVELREHIKAVRFTSGFGGVAFVAWVKKFGFDVGGYSETDGMIYVWDNVRDDEVEVADGSWLVIFSNNQFEVFNDFEFRLLFRDIRWKDIFDDGFLDEAIFKFPWVDAFILPGRSEYARFKTAINLVGCVDNYCKAYNKSDVDCVWVSSKYLSGDGIKDDEVCVSVGSWIIILKNKRLLVFNNSDFEKVFRKF